MQTAYAFDAETIAKIMRGAAIAGLGAFLTYFVQYAGEVDFGSLTPIVVAALSVAVNALREYAKGE